jgi:predicted phosphohydrolase
MRIVALADIHCQRDIKVPEGDLLIVAGDLTYRGRLPELEEVLKFLQALPHKHKVMIAGNHDFCFENAQKLLARKMVADHGLTYLQDDATAIEGKLIYGSPWQPWFHNWAFNQYRGDLHKIWAKIPANVDILVTHGPPYGYGDMTGHGRVGCEELLTELKVKKPKYLFFGHIHEDIGQWTMEHEDGSKTLITNCSVGPDYSWNPRERGEPVVVDV